MEPRTSDRRAVRRRDGRGLQTSRVSDRSVANRRPDSDRSGECEADTRPRSARPIDPGPRQALEEMGSLGQRGDRDGRGRMISREDIRGRAAEWQLTVGVVEKDYVLGWLLAAVAEHREASHQWVFKGGTCLKKCFFETYRFSEDLDFSLLPGARYSADELQSILREVAARASELSGIEFPADTIVVRDRRNLQGAPTFEGRIAYRGPMADPSLPRVRFDLTRNEPLLDGVAQRGVFHAFPDTLPEGTTVGSYTIDELFAEKLRALAERTRPRDLYDVIF